MREQRNIEEKRQHHPRQSREAYFCACLNYFLPSRVCRDRFHFQQVKSGSSSCELVFHVLLPRGCQTPVLCSPVCSAARWHRSLVALLALPPGDTVALLALHPGDTVALLCPSDSWHCWVPLTRSSVSITCCWKAQWGEMRWLDDSSTCHSCNHVLSLVAFY